MRDVIEQYSQGHLNMMVRIKELQRRSGDGCDDDGDDGDDGYDDDDDDDFDGDVIGG